MKQAKTISISENIKLGWQLTKKNFGLLLAIMLINFIPARILESIGGSSFDLGNVLSWLYSTFISIGVLVISLKLIDNKKAKIEDLFKSAPLFLNFLITQIIFSTIVVVGLCLLILPGIYLFLKYQFAPILVVDKKLDPIDALKKSSQITKGKMISLLMFVLAIIGLNILGVLALVVGVIVTTMISMLAYTKIYRQLSV